MSCLKKELQRCRILKPEAQSILTMIPATALNPNVRISNSANEHNDEEDHLSIEENTTGTLTPPNEETSEDDGAYTTPSDNRITPAKVIAGGTKTHSRAQSAIRMVESISPCFCCPRRPAHI